MPSSRLITLAALVLSGAAAFAGTPQRVVSLNVCTDQLAMMVAGEGQLLSLSQLSIDPRISAMHEEARGFHINSARAEEIYLLKPDLVLAGTYTARASVQMLERLGVRVVRFEPASTLADVPLRLLQMGEALGQEARAEALVAEFEAGLAALRAATPEQRPRAVQYGANGFTSGSDSMSGEMLELAGFANVAAELGYARGGPLPLELLAMSAPDVVLTSEPYPGASRSEEVPRHPVVAASSGGRAPIRVSSRDWICGTPHVLRGVATLAAKREALGQ